jgi:DNA-binding transcriptional LysR family regulator
MTNLICAREKRHSLNLQEDFAGMNMALDIGDLRIVLEIARGNGLSGAARALRVNHATVFRQLGRIEEALGVRLFERFRTGYSPTPAGEAAVAVAERVEAEVAELERRVAGQDLRPSGTVRITTTDTLLPLLAHCFRDVREEHPEITLEVVISNAFLSLSRRDADIAVRPARDPPPELVGRRISTIAYAIYGVGPSDQDASLANLSWVAPDDSLAHLGSAKWMQANVPAQCVIARSNTVLGLLELAKAGIGVAALPCFLGDLAVDLVRLRDPDATMATELWLLTHDDLRRVSRIRAVLDGLAAALQRRRALLEGSLGDA